MPEASDIELSLVMPCLNEAETLATCIGESSGLRKRDLSAAVASVEAGLKALGIHHHSHKQVF